MSKLRLYEITNGFSGFSYVRVYVFATSEKKAVETAIEKFNEGKIGDDKFVTLKVNSSVEVVDGYCSDLSDEGLNIAVDGPFAGMPPVQIANHGDVLVCLIGGKKMFGTQEEADAAQIPIGSRVEGICKAGNRFAGVLRNSWCYDEPMYTVELDGGRMVTAFFGGGDRIWPEGKPPTEKDGA